MPSVRTPLLFSCLLALAARADPLPFAPTAFLILSCQTVAAYGSPSLSPSFISTNVQDTKRYRCSEGLSATAHSLGCEVYNVETESREQEGAGIRPKHSAEGDVGNHCSEEEEPFRREHSRRPEAWSLRLRGGGSKHRRKEGKDRAGREGKPASPTLKAILEESEDGMMDEEDDRRSMQTQREGDGVDYEYEYRKLLVEVQALREALKEETRRGDEEDERDNAEDDADDADEESFGEEDGEEEDESDRRGFGSKNSEHRQRSPLSASGAAQASWDSLSGGMRRFAKYIPVRLGTEDRRLLRLLQAALSVSEYTDRVDVLTFGGSKVRSQRMVAMIREMCALLCGLTVANDYKRGQQLMANKEYHHHAPLFQRIFEVGRRYKQMNPDKLRSSYGKLIFLLQDSQAPDVQDMLGFECVTSVATVASTLADGGAEAMLNDEVLKIATSEIASRGRRRSDVERDIRTKEKAVKFLVDKYRAPDFSADTVRLCIYSLADYQAYLRHTREPVEEMLRWLRQHFAPERAEHGFSLAIERGVEGSRLTHSHARQYRFVEQSLMLWREVLTELPRLWHLAERDMLDPDSPYSLRDTGQGLNRVQRANRVGKAMGQILAGVQAKLGSRWEGSTVIHLGDHNVPNALVFLDKYTQIERILSPLVLTLHNLQDLSSQPAIARYIEDAFGGVGLLTKGVLADFFRSAFDGSGADNFFDAGSCIDGRLTSAWNWCNSVERKPFFPAFLLTGFTGFDGKFTD